MRGVKFRNNDADYHHCTETRLVSTLGVVYQVFVLRLCVQSLSGLIPSLDAQQLGARTVSPSRCRSCITNSRPCNMAGPHKRTMMDDSRTLSTQSISEGANGSISNDALSGRRRRETARHACQNCRRRKIKVGQHSHLCQATNFLTWLRSATKLVRLASHV